MRSFYWLFHQDRELDVPTLIERGKDIDGGMSGEVLLTNVVGTELRVGL